MSDQPGDSLPKGMQLTTFDDVRQILRDKDMSADPRKANPTSYVARIRG